MSSPEAHRGSSTLEPPHPTRPANGRSFGPGRALRQGGKVLPEHARGHNRSLLLQTLFHQGAMSRADLSRETGLTRVTISDLIAELIADGFVAEMGVREASGPGKPAILVDLDRDGHRIVGIDLSGSDVFIGAVLTLDGDIVARREVAASSPTATSSRRSSRSLAISSATSHAPVLGIGVGTPGIVNDARRHPHRTRTCAGRASTSRARSKRALGLPVLVANDANAAVLAEYTFGGAGDDVLLVKVGRGVGSGLLASGQPMRGAALRRRRDRARHRRHRRRTRSASAARSAASRPGSRCPH